MPYRFWSVVLTLLVNGCISADPERAEESERDAPEGPMVITREFSGFVLYRIPAGTPTCDQQYGTVEGHPPLYYILVPPGTLRLTAYLTWDTAEPMSLQLYEPGEMMPTYDGREPTNPRPPRMLDIENPVPGEWAVYTGPSYATSARWNATLRWEVAPGVDEAATVSPNEMACAPDGGSRGVEATGVSPSQPSR